MDAPPAFARGGFAGALVGAVVYFSHQTLLLVTAGYTAHGPVMQLVRTVRHRLASRPA